MSVIIGIVKSVGELISIERVTRNRTQLNDVRYYVNMDITKELLKEVDLTEEGEQIIHKQEIVYMNMPFESTIC